MFYKEYKPCDELRKFIKCFWIMEREYSSDLKFGDTEYLWPTGLTEILYVDGPNFRYVNKLEEIVLPNEIVIGAYSKKFVLKNNGSIKIIGIRCYNHGANSLFEIDLNKIKNMIVGYNLKEINKSILDSEDKDYIIEYLNSYSKKLILEDEFTNILYKFYKEDIVSLEQLCIESNLSLRQFERKVKKITSFTPKELMTIIRFDKARIKMLFNKDYISVMNDLGYYDYSHFSKDFKKFYEVTPKQFIEIYPKAFD